MSEAQRRFQRFIVSAGAFKGQRVKAAGMFGLVKRWGECKVHDISQAGALVLSKTTFDMGDAVVIELEPIDGTVMRFDGEVVNLGREHSSGLYKLGVRLLAPKPGTTEMEFLDTLEQRFKICP